MCGVWVCVVCVYECVCGMCVCVCVCVACVCVNGEEYDGRIASQSYSNCRFFPSLSLSGSCGHWYHWGQHHQHVLWPHDIKGMTPKYDPLVWPLISKVCLQGITTGIFHSVTYHMHVCIFGEGIAFSCCAINCQNKFICYEEWVTVFPVPLFAADHLWWHEGWGAGYHGKSTGQLLHQRLLECSCCCGEVEGGRGE